MIPYLEVHRWHYLLIMASPTLQSFDQADSLLPVPESSRKQHQVQLAVKVLETEKETRKMLYYFIAVLLAKI